MPDVVVSAAAENEYESAFVWYSERSWRAAVGFEEAFADILARIAAFPLSYPASDREDFRYALLPNYPYCVTFDVKNDKIEIVAVSHTSRKPRSK